MKQVRHSDKRDAILTALRNTKEHPSAETLYESLKKTIPDLSLGTVYRNLSKFKEDGAIIAVSTVNGQERYDADISRHDHFICGGCGAVIDVQENSVCENNVPDGFKVTRIETVYRGLCSNCVDN
ncbi:MAG: transcriptional repressor [Oscillospiraceae bacterium]|nr:transcriptional repressor [Oscillospiraceae bacterium]